MKDISPQLKDMSKVKKKNIYWLYEINDEFAQVGAADYTLEDGDVISWELEPSE